jgi:Flp pilus assembly pilin Flp
MKNFSQFKQRQLGQGMTEYIIIVALIAVAAIGTYGYFGQSMRNQVSALATEISGQDSGTQITAAQTAATAATVEANQEYNLGNYNEGADQGSGGGND